MKLHDILAGIEILSAAVSMDLEILGLANTIPGR